MSQFLRWIYSLIFALLMPLILLRLCLRSRRNKAYRERWLERFALSPLHQKKEGIWVHTVSMGECIAAIPLIKCLQVRYPDLPITVTSMTITGSAYIQKTFGKTIFHTYVPYDFYWMQRRFLKALAPRCVILLETELWPNLLNACRKEKVKVLLANGRLSQQSYQQYRWVLPIVKEMLKNITSIAVQEEAHKNRFHALGAPLSAIHVTGSLKFDMMVSPEQIEKGKILRSQLGENRAVWIAASTHEGEESIILATHQKLKKQFPDVVLILVPRHPERFEKVINYGKTAGLSLLQYSQYAQWNKEAASSIDVVVGDTMGDLIVLYAASDLAFVGGSFIAQGGHNPLEPALLGLPVVMGQSTFNFTEVAAKLIASGGMTQVSDQNHLIHTIKQWLLNPELIKQKGEQVKAVVDNNRGAVEKHLALIDKCLSGA
ncbi:MAG: kdtA [Gammaproteobacteria bacterium]|nr:kdtA [Gammaproteobacteria bacterium]